ncbi:LysR family transcriptional regulator [Paraburkholderia terrae]|nr:LysR family transcriptional regulator [Paraburkholderia terrae]
MLLTGAPRGPSIRLQTHFPVCYLMHFGLVDLQTFAAVAEAGSLTHGAARVNLSLAAVSARIRQMEEAVGVPLLERRPHGIRVTEAGQTFLRHARVTLGALQRMTDDLAQLSQGMRGTIRILSNTNALVETLPGPLSRFLCDNPNINIEIEQRPSDEIIAAIAEGVADIGIIASPPEGVALTTFPFATDRLCAVVPAVDERFALQREIAFADLIEADFVGHERGSSIQVFLENQAKRLYRTLRHRIQLGNFESICRLVENGVGVAVIPESAARRFQRSMRVRLLRITDAWAVRKILICVNDLEQLPSSTRRLVEHLAHLGAASG